MSSFEDAYVSYFQALRERDISDQRSNWEEYRNYVDACQEVQHDLQQRVQEAWQRHQQEQGDDPSGQQALSSAYQDYVIDTQQAQLDAKQAYDECVTSYQRAMSQLWHQSRAARGEAFRSYLASVQGAWTEIEPDQFDPAALAPVARSLLAAASVAASQGTGVASAAAGPSAAGAPEGTRHGPEKDNETTQA
jgi:hypothetical protein